MVILENNRESKSDRLLGIQYLRGIAAILVVLFHVTGMSRFPKYFNFNILSGYFDLGDVGVQLFFVISGFIIVYVSVETGTLKSKIGIKDFFLKRLIRIIPFMWVCIITFAILRYLTIGYFPWPSYVRAFFLFPIGEVDPKQIWTLRHEFLFYIVFALSVLRFKRWDLLILWSVSPFFWHLLKEYFVFNDSAIIELGDFTFSRFNILFGIGCAIAVMYKKGHINLSFKTNYGYIFSIISIIPLLIVLDYLRNSDYFSILVEEVIIGIICGGIVIFGIMITEMKTNYLNQTGKVLGDSSYSIYLFHGIPIAAILGVWSKVQIDAQPILVLVIVSFISCLVGIVVYYLIEKPLVKFVQSFLK